MRNLTHRFTKSGHFPQLRSTFFHFSKKGRGDLLPPSCAPVRKAIQLNELSEYFISIINESTKWRAQRAHVPYVPYVPTCLTCLTCPTCSTCSSCPRFPRALRAHVPKYILQTRKLKMLVLMMVLLVR